MFSINCGLLTVASGIYLYRKLYLKVWSWRRQAVSWDLLWPFEEAQSQELGIQDQTCLVSFLSDKDMIKDNILLYYGFLREDHNNDVNIDLSQILTIV